MQWCISQCLSHILPKLLLVITKCIHIFHKLEESSSHLIASASLIYLRFLLREIFTSVLRWWLLNVPAGGSTCVITEDQSDRSVCSIVSREPLAEWIWASAAERWPLFLGRPFSPSCSGRGDKCLWCSDHRQLLPCHDGWPLQEKWELCRKIIFISNW